MKHAQSPLPRKAHKAEVTPVGELRSSTLWGKGRGPPGRGTLVAQLSARLFELTASVRLHEIAKLLVHGQEIKIIPCLDNLSIIDPEDCHAGKLDWRLSSSSSHELS